MSKQFQNGIMHLKTLPLFKDTAFYITHHLGIFGKIVLTKPIANPDTHSVQ